MPIEPVKGSCGAPVHTVEIGGFGSKTVKAGGESCMSFLFGEGSMPNAPIIAMEVADVVPEDMPDCVKERFGKAIEDPVKWAAACVNEFGSRALSVRLLGLHPDYGSRSASDEQAILRGIMQETGVPLIVTGCGDDEKDNDAMPKVSQALKGHNCLLGIATQANYKTLAATCLADGHSIIAESPIDINIAKQVNILITDMGFDPARIVMHPTTTSLGYGMEYVYSIMERSRLAAFIGDRMLAMPFIVFVGQETWKAKEAKESAQQGTNWELVTAVSMLQSGADMIVMRDPAAAQSAEKYIQTMMKWKREGAADDSDR
jgi:acetyl-CoA decarbonylase/synthase complex subunit delta